tara:strand:+ start:3147 stop:3695 length:549 start_codon:yes stop_codon:yes gene_type:complete
MLCYALQKYGNVEHIHSKNPPNKLEYIGYNMGGNCYGEWFNGIKIPENEINNYYVIYLYKNPVNSILSRFLNSAHLEHIQSDKNITIEDIVNSSKDLYGVQEFYNNYTKNNKDKNYKIYCVKYEDIFEKQDELSAILNIGSLNLIKRETKYEELENKYHKKLNEIYKDLINTMNNNDFITIN